MHCMSDPSALYKVSDPRPWFPFITVCTYKIAAVSFQHWSVALSIKALLANIFRCWKESWRRFANDLCILQERDSPFLSPGFRRTAVLETSRQSRRFSWCEKSELPQKKLSLLHTWADPGTRKKLCMNILASTRRARLMLPSPSLPSRHPCN